ncbi:TAXI family TRAP transporter solute-binding subunit [uncultured Pseudodesulfovibrio sp.]|uniref:TAXI family TRAP transporter solute-binding subunit n=1 Tax=uncultured Pseudodesulfovibrio sp. TaxID=2035858 RepID=UPI0029C700E9|nr:TAXI family TRAP transporter solute-binding subunit [uncultured Pseudodesulfovibrio sp.]
MKLLKSHVTTSVAVYGGAVILLLAAIWTAYQYVDPAPPKKVTIAAGSRSGAYYQNALKYAKIFAEQGVELEILETKGSMDNLARMSAPDSTVGAAFMQGGIAEHDEHPDLRSLGSLYYEPLWVFHRKGLKIKALPELKGLKVAIGPKGSGTNDLITNILDENGVEPDNADLIETPTSDTVRHLLDGTVDVMFLISGIHSDTIHALSAPNSGVHLMSFTRAEAYSRSHRYLTQLTLPRGAINLADDIPSTNVNMLAPTANLVVQEDLHPALKFLFLLAARQVHSKGDIFAQPGTFPNQDALLFPLAEEAESFYKNGPPLLMRYLPYSLAITAERLKILLIPLLTLLYPLFKFTPPAYRWQIRRRIFKWYKHLKQIDIEAYDITTHADAQKMIARLETMDREVLNTSVPLSYTDYIYSLRIHISLIRARLEKLDEEITA